MNTLEKTFLTLGLIFIALGILLIFQIQTLGKLRLVFCDVGQGDGILIITPSGKQILIDGGPGKKITQCLSSKMPFWDRNIELMIYSHPQQDHIEGQIDVFEKYHVARVFYTGVGQQTQVFEKWKQDLEAGKFQTLIAKRGDQVEVGNVTFEVLWPSVEKVAEWQKNPSTDTNDLSIVLRLKYGDFCAYFAGDIPKEILDNVSDSQCDVLKISHHGSKTGTDSETLAKIKPKVAVIQVGKNNRYGHPNQEVLDLLHNANVKVLRNDLEGTIELDFGKNGLRLN